MAKKRQLQASYNRWKLEKAKNSLPLSVLLSAVWQECLGSSGTENIRQKPTVNVSKTMIRRKSTPKVSRGRAIQIAMNHNCVSRGMAERYTDSELKEVLKQLKLKADF